MSAQKKGIYWYKIGNGRKAYYIGGGVACLTRAQGGLTGAAMGLPPTVMRAFPSLCGAVSHGVVGE